MTTNPRRFCGNLLPLVAAIALGVFCSAHAAWAGQAQEASIIGQITDESGAVLPGVTVTATSPSLQLQQLAVVTNERGEYRLTPLPIGTYRVDYTLQGFQSVRREGLRLTAGFVAKVDEVLKVGTVAETITVSGAAPIVDVTSTASRTELTREALEAIPVGRSGYQALLAQAPGVRTNLDVGGNTTATNPSFRVFGQNGDSWSTLEGVLTTSPKSGTQGGNYFDYASIEEATVQTAGSNADAATRGVQLNVILKSGGNDFHGLGFLAATTSGMVSDNIDDTLRAQGVTSGNPINQRWDVNADIGGRIIRNKLWFYYSARARQQVNGVVGSFLKPDGSPVDQTQLLVFSTEKVSWQMNPSNKLIGFHQKNYQDFMNYLASRYAPWDSRVQALFYVDTGKGEWQYAKGNKFLSLQFGRWDWHVDYSGFSDQTATLDQLTLAVTGNNATAGTTSFEDRSHLKGTLTWYKPDLLVGNHDFKVGFDYSDAHADRKIIDRGASANYQLIYRNSAPFQLAAWNNPAVPDDRVRYFGAYVQDSWSIERRLTLNLGLRYAHDNGFIREQCRVAAPAPLDVVYPAQCFPFTQFTIWNPVQPRVNAAYDIAGNGKTVIKGGWGRFAHMRYVDELQMANENVPLTTTYRWHDDNGNRLYDAGEVNFALNGPDFISTITQAGPALAHAVPNPNEHEPSTDDFMASIERELLPNFAVRFTALYSQVHDTYRVQNNRRPYGVYNIPIRTADPGPDGRANSGDEPGTTITYWEYPTSFSPVAFQQPMLINDSNSDASFKSYEIALSKRLSNRWLFMGSYSATKSHIPYVQNTSGVGDFVQPGLAVFLTTYDPNAEIFTANNTWEWLGRASGSYTFPADILVSAHFENRSGIPFARTVSATGGTTIPSIAVRVEPIGARRTTNVNILDFRAEKAIRLGAQRLSLRLNFYNMLNVNTVTSLNQQSGSTFLGATAIVPPRTAEVSAQYTF
jgi:Carboxypeptidase regulatory-like domain/TonB dependent receptor-like, beta-barrel